MQNFAEERKKPHKMQLTQPWECVAVVITRLVRSQEHAGICHCQGPREHLRWLQQHPNEEGEINHALDVPGQCIFPGSLQAATGMS